MNRRLSILVLMASVQISLSNPKTVFSQWYANPQANGASANAALNGSLYGGNGFLFGSGMVPGFTSLPGGAGIVPGGAVSQTNPGVTGTGQAGSVGSGTGTGAGTNVDTDGGDVGSVSLGSQFTSDPVSAYTNSVYSGMSNLIRSEGQYNRQTSKAMINYEQARTLYIDNQQRLFSARRAIFRARLAARAEDIEYQHAAEARAEAFIASHRPLPLPHNKLNPSTGQIEWPTLLKATDFEEGRKSLESLFEARNKSGNATETSPQIKKQIHEMKESLHSHVLQLPIEEYSEARQFLDQLAASNQ